MFQAEDIRDSEGEDTDIPVRHKKSKKSVANKSPQIEHIKKQQPEIVSTLRERRQAQKEKPQKVKAVIVPHEDGFSFDVHPRRK